MAGMQFVDMYKYVCQTNIYFLEMRSDNDVSLWCNLLMRSKHALQKKTFWSFSKQNDCRVINERTVLYITVEMVKSWVKLT